MRKIGFKLRVMRLNRVELFYALVAAIGNGSRRCLWGRGGHMHVVCMQRWLAMARPPAGATGYSQGPPARGRPAAARPPARGDRPQGQQPAWGSHPRARPAHKGLPPAASPATNRGGRPLPGRLPPAKGSRRLRRGNDGVVRVKEG
ncbi:hypothetical protein GW17_00053012 [Ensete ventricosum]|nr:hypothetical protein GW17_00053012 [Ensete ventricosum]